MTTLGIASAGFSNVFGTTRNYSKMPQNFSAMENPIVTENSGSIIGAYGKWAAGLNENKLPALSFRKQEFLSTGSMEEECASEVNRAVECTGYRRSSKGDCKKTILIRRFTRRGT